MLLNIKREEHFTITHVGSFGAFITINNFSFKLFIRPSESDAKESRKAMLCLEKRTDFMLFVIKRCYETRNNDDLFILSDI